MQDTHLRAIVGPGVVLLLFVALRDGVDCRGGAAFELRADLLVQPAREISVHTVRANRVE
jgi:hypothetical protein